MKCRYKEFKIRVDSNGKTLVTLLRETWVLDVIYPISRLFFLYAVFKFKIIDYYNRHHLWSKQQAQTRQSDKSVGSWSIWEIVERTRPKVNRSPRITLAIEKRDDDCWTIKTSQGLKWNLGI